MTRPTREEINAQPRLTEPMLFDIEPIHKAPEGVISTRDGHEVKVVNNDIFLTVKGSDKPREVGWVNKHGINIRRDREAHLVRMWNCYGVSFDVINQMSEFRNLILHENHEGKVTAYRIPTGDVKRCRVAELGGFELQYFIPLEMLKEELS